MRVRAKCGCVSLPTRVVDEYLPDFFQFFLKFFLDLQKHLRYSATEPLPNPVNPYDDKGLRTVSEARIS